MSKIVMFEGYRKRPKKRRHLGKHKRKHSRKGKRKFGNAHRVLFGKVAKVCLTGKASRKKKGACMRVGLKKGITAAQKFAQRM